MVCQTIEQSIALAPVATIINDFMNTLREAIELLEKELL